MTLTAGDEGRLRSSLGTPLSRGDARELAAATTRAERVAATAISALTQSEQRTLRTLAERVC